MFIFGWVCVNMNLLMYIRPLMHAAEHAHTGTGGANRVLCYCTRACTDAENLKSLRKEGSCTTWTLDWTVDWTMGRTLYVFGRDLGLNI